MRKIVYLLIVALGIIFTACSGSKDFNNGFVQYSPVSLSENDKNILKNNIQEFETRYDDSVKMITKRLTGWNYHTDAESGTYHEVRGSFTYALALLDFGNKDFEQRAFDVIDATLSLQDQDPQSPSYGVWPYYKEEPLSTKKSPIDYNWADFSAVLLLDIYMGHKDKFPDYLLKKLENALILAARAVKKRNCPPSYTNIAIMGTYVTYVTSHLFDIADLKEYASERLDRFYKYTMNKGGFTEYNSPTYTIIAIDELKRMQMHIVEPKARKMIDELYSLCWSMIARHYHKTSAQWAGPHSRCYNTLVDISFYGILNEASDGRIDLGYGPTRPNVKIKHKIPEELMHYFLEPKYPRTEIDVFENTEPKVIGTTYLTDSYSLSTSSRSCLWNQRRPFLAYWGECGSAHYLRLRFLRDNYDFATTNIFSVQNKNNILSVINTSTNGGTKHLYLDSIKDGKFTSSDIRIRFELGNCDEILADLPQQTDKQITVLANGMKFNVRMLEARWDDSIGYWEKGSDGQNSWVDYVIYKGKEKSFDLIKMKEAAFALAMSFGNDELVSIDNANVSVKSGIMDASWNGLKVSASIKPEKQPKNINDHAK